MVIRSGDGMIRSTARPAGINGKMRLDKEIRQLQQTSQMGSLPHRCQTSHKVRENPRWLSQNTLVVQKGSVVLHQRKLRRQPNPTAWGQCDRGWRIARGFAGCV